MHPTVQSIIYWLITLILGVAYVAQFVFYRIWFRALEKSDKNLVKQMQPSILSDNVYGSHKYFKRDDIKLHYVESGEENNQVVILVHGVPGFWFCWRKQIPELAKHFRVIAIDLRGCGDSEVSHTRKSYAKEVVMADIIYLINNLGCSNVFLVCSETSGYLGWEIASSYPHLISKLVLINFPHISVINQMFHSKIYNYVKFWYALFLQFPFLPEATLSRDQTQQWLRKFLDPLVKSKSITDEELEAYKYVFSRVEDWIGVINHLRQIDLRPSNLQKWSEKIAVLTTPTLVLAGSSHPYFTIESAYRSAEIVERISVKVIQNAGNNLQISHPKMANKEILSFLNPQPIFLKAPMPLESKQPSFVGRMFGVVKNNYIL